MIYYIGVGTAPPPPPKPSSSSYAYDLVEFKQRLIIIAVFYVVTKIAYPLLHQFHIQWRSQGWA